MTNNHLLPKSRRGGVSFFSHNMIFERRIYLHLVWQSVKWMGYFRIVSFCVCFGLGLGHEVIQSHLWCAEEVTISC